jgi:hypothetical protein
MPLFNVHIYREMRLYFPGIHAASPDEAARVAADKPTGDAEYAEDCDGENLAALVDVVGDEQFEQSVAIDFDHERMRKAAPDLLEALTAVKAALLHYPHWQDSMRGHLLAVTDAALASATLIRQPAIERKNP